LASPTSAPTSCKLVDQISYSVLSSNIDRNYSMAETIFKKIIYKQIPARIVHEDDHCLAFHDVAPQAPVHVLVIPKKEIESLEHLANEDAALLGHIWLTIQKIAREQGLASDGYRVVVNCGQNGGQSVDHLHFHILGGRPLKWPPG
jgi:histidine triad (HIT) family protein